MAVNAIQQTHAVAPEKIPTLSAPKTQSPAPKVTIANHAVNEAQAGETRNYGQRGYGEQRRPGTGQAAKRRGDANQRHARECPCLSSRYTRLRTAPCRGPACKASWTDASRLTLEPRAISE